MQNGAVKPWKLSKTSFVADRDVRIGNPLTLMIIEFFAVPAALAGSLLYPLGLDAPVWLWLGLGIDIILAAARMLASMPASTVHLREFAPWALPFLSLAVLSMTIWRTNLFRLTALPFLAIGLYGATHGPRWDVAIQPTGETAAVRGANGELVTIGRFSGFTSEQWLRADADGRDPAASRGGQCDKAGCVARLPDGAALALVSDYAGLAEDCSRAKILVTPLYAPWGCAAPLLIDRRKLEETGAITLRYVNGEPVMQTARAPGEDRPWSPAPGVPKPWSSPHRSARPTPSPRWPRSPTRWSASSRPGISWPSARAMTISARPRMRRCVRCWRPPTASGPGRKPASRLKP